MVGPEEDHIIGGAVEGLDCIAWNLGKINGSELLQVGQTRLKICGGAVGCRVVVGVSEDLDVRVESFEGMFGVLLIG